MIVLPVPSLLSPPVLIELQLSDLITSEECEELSGISDVLETQSGKSPEVMSKTAGVLRCHTLEEESELFAGSFHFPVL